MRNKILSSQCARGAFLALMACLQLFCLTLPAQRVNVADPAWFEHVVSPSRLEPAVLRQFCLQAHQALRSSSPGTSLRQLSLDDPSARVMFLSIGGQQWPARTYFGAGHSFREAWINLIDILLANESIHGEKAAAVAKGMISDAQKNKQPISPVLLERQKNPLAWEWIRLDLVQSSIKTPNFSISHSRLALPSLVGLAFEPQLGFAFPPAQLTGRCLLEPSRHLAQQQIGNLISESFNWNALQEWQRICSDDVGFTVHLFEVDSYYCDGRETVSLFRSHPFAKSVTADDCLEAATNCATQVAAALHPRTGAFVPPFPEWSSSLGQDTEAIDVQAEIAYALARLGQASKNQQLVTAAELAMRPVVAAVKRASKTKKQFAIVEDEILPADSSLAPRPVANLRTNALACLTLVELEQATGKKQYREQMLALAQQLQRQAQPGGAFMWTVLHPSGQFLDADTLSQAAKTEAESMAILALLRVGQRTQNGALLALADESLPMLLLSRVSKVTLENLACTPWLAEALSQYLLRNKEFTTEMSRLSFIAGVDVVSKPLYPDLYGSVRQWPSATIAAERSWMLAILARWFRVGGDIASATDCLTSMAPLLIFQMQARMTAAASSSLSRPGLYHHFFRDHFEDFGFELSGQATQILSLLHAWEEFNASPQPLSDAMTKAQTALQEVQQDLFRHPLVLSPELIRTEKSSGRDSRSMTGGMPAAQQNILRPTRRGGQAQPAAGNKQRQKR